MGIGIVQCAAEQVIMLGYAGEQPSGSLGASSILFGLMVMALIWAPKNEMSCVFFLWLIPRTVEVSILVFGLFYVGWNFLVATLTGFSMSTATLHLSGALFGVVLLKTEVVDCEGWDVFALWRGDIGAGLAHKGAAAKAAEEAEAESCEPHPRNEELIAEAKKRLRNFLRQGNVNAAVALHQKMAKALRSTKRNC